MIRTNAFRCYLALADSFDPSILEQWGEPLIYPAMRPGPLLTEHKFSFSEDFYFDVTKRVTGS